MEHGYGWVMDVALPAILLIILIWLVVKARSSRDKAVDRRAEQGTRELYAEEEERRREGTDRL
jgi:membrane protein implicated in regulation of membrane protease activity